MYDCIIIGCGITGAAAAYRLARYRGRFAVLEKSNDVANATTKANSAIIHAGYDPAPGTQMSRLNVEGNRQAAEICQKLNVPFRRTGSLVLAFSEEECRTLDELYRRGVRILTLVWGGMSCIGGAFDDGAGLTEFGREVLERCFSLGIVPDLSHASDALFQDAAVLAEDTGKPIIASHSCSRRLCPHMRNLTDRMFRRIAELGGLVGVNLVRSHLGGEVCDMDRVTEHLMHFWNIGGEDVVCLGCDMDGTSPLPDGIEGVEDLPKLYDRICKNAHSQRVADKIFYTNARNFFDRWIRM